MADLWSYLSGTQKPIVMYGMGDGAAKIMDVLTEFGIKPAAFMASDGFVRGHSFMGYKVETLTEIEQRYSEFIILLCFGSSLSAVRKMIMDIAEKHELYAPYVPVVGNFNNTYLQDNKEKVEAVYELFKDKQSQNVFESWIKYRYTGKLNYLSDWESSKLEAYTLLNISETETYVDAGAYNGDTVQAFLNVTNKHFNKIIAIEPDKRNYAMLLRKHYGLGYEIFNPINAVCWKEDTELPFSHKSGRQSSLLGSGRQVMTPARSIDSILGGMEATIIKYDVEGAEKEALIGSKRTIERYKPKLIVSLYHRTEDMLELPLQISKMNKGYTFFLRHHPYFPDWDTNLYCV